MRRFRLAGADRLDDDAVEAAGVERVDGGARRPRQAAELAARRERADEDVRMRRVRAHADAVAEDRAAADRARRVDRDHGDRVALGEPGAEQRVDQRRLAAAGNAGDADDPGAAGALAPARRGLARAGPVVVDQRQQARERAPVARDRPVGEARRGGRRVTVRR